MRDTLFRAGICFLLCAVVLPLKALACATVEDLRTRVQVVDESAVIVWEAATHTEHFIRRATFATGARDFGFLVPTPTKPTLTAVGDSVFTRLEVAILPKHRTVVQTHRDYTPWLLRRFLPEYQLTAVPNLMKSASVMQPGSVSSSPVRVLDAEQVAGYDTVVLEADNAEALAGWLKSHGYASRPALASWLEPYVAAHRKLTAFKFARRHDAEERAPEIAASAVRMSFQTDRPYFPYREPADQRSDANASFLPRTLRVYLFSTERVSGTIGASSSATDWPGATVWADRLPEPHIISLAEPLQLPTNDLTQTPYLTVMEDRSSPRPGTDDVYFNPSANQARIVPPPIITYQDQTLYIPLDALLLVPLSLAAVVSRLRPRVLQSPGPRSLRQAGHRD